MHRNIIRISQEYYDAFSFRGSGGLRHIAGACRWRRDRGLTADFASEPRGSTTLGVRGGARDSRSSGSASTSRRMACAISPPSGLLEAVKSNSCPVSELSYYNKHGQKLWAEPRRDCRRLRVSSGRRQPWAAAGTSARGRRRSRSVATAFMPVTGLSTSPRTMQGLSCTSRVRMGRR